MKGATQSRYCPAVPTSNGSGDAAIAIGHFPTALKCTTSQGARSNLNLPCIPRKRHPHRCPAPASQEPSNFWPPMHIHTSPRTTESGDVAENALPVAKVLG